VNQNTQASAVRTHQNYITRSREGAKKNLLAQIRANLHNASMSQLNISVPDALKGWIDSRLAEGRYSSPSDYVRDLVRRDQERADETAWVQAMIDEGMASETLGQDPRDVIDEIVAQGRNLRAAA
jgi:antitoxin ParD1/3/4